eukprot:1920737-Pleurochrysis_carterae.AAC.1
MHIFIQGALRCELAGVIYLMVRRYKWIPSIKALNESIRRYKFPNKSRKPPELPNCLRMGTNDNKPRADAT